MKTVNCVFSLKSYFNFPIVMKICLYRLHLKIYFEKLLSLEFSTFLSKLEQKYDNIFVLFTQKSYFSLFWDSLLHISTPLVKVSSCKVWVEFSQMFWRGAFLYVDNVYSPCLYLPFGKSITLHSKKHEFPSPLYQVLLIHIFALFFWRKHFYMWKMCIHPVSIIYSLEKAWLITQRIMGFIKLIPRLIDTYVCPILLEKKMLKVFHYIFTMSKLTSFKCCGYSFKTRKV